MDYRPEEVVTIVYVNYRAEVGERRIVPRKLWFGATEYHPAQQWLLDAYDLDKKANRTFACKDITDWR